MMSSNKKMTICKWNSISKWIFIPRLWPRISKTMRQWSSNSTNYLREFRSLNLKMRLVGKQEMSKSILKTSDIFWTKKSRCFKMKKLKFLKNSKKKSKISNKCSKNSSKKRIRMIKSTLNLRTSTERRIFKWDLYKKSRIKIRPWRPFSPSFNPPSFRSWKLLTK